MGDIGGTIGSELITMDGALKNQQIQIAINEKQASLRGLQINLDNLKNIQERKILLQMDILTREISKLRSQLIIDAETVENKEE